MTLLSICQSAADEIGITRPSAVIGSSQDEVKKLLRYANRAGVQLMKQVVWQALRKEKTFTALGQEAQTSILPSDFDRFIAETFWNRSDSKLVTGPVSSVEWQGLKALSYTGDPKFAYRGDSVLLIPSPTAGDTLAFEYVSNLWCESSGGTGQTAWAADSDVGVIDEELITRAVKFMFLVDEGLPAAVAAKDFDDYLGLLLMNDQPDAGVVSAGDIFGGRHFNGTPPSATSVNVL